MNEQMTTVKITGVRGLHLRPSQILEKKIKQIKGDVYFIKDNLRKKICGFKDVLSLQVAQGDTIGIQVFPNSKKNLEEIQEIIIEINSTIFS